MSNRRILDRYPEAVAWTEEVTIVGRGINLIGALSSPDVILIAGHVDGEVVSEKLVRVMPGGLVRGPVRAAVVIVEGAVDGEIVATENFVLAKTGRVRGDVHGPTIAVAEGGYLKGNLRAIEGGIHRFRERRAV